VKPQNLRARRLYETEGFTLTPAIPGTDLLVMTRQVTA
jgi:hypothetical protein